jgi:hypothetical protein
MQIYHLTNIFLLAVYHMTDCILGNMLWSNTDPFNLHKLITFDLDMNKKQPANSNPCMVA